MKDLKALPTPEKKVAAKVLVEKGYSVRQAEEILGVDFTTVSRYAKEETPEELQRFATILHNAIDEKKNKILVKGLDRLNTLVPNETKISEVVKALEYVEGKNESGNPSIAVQVNNNYNSNKYLED